MTFSSSRVFLLVGDILALVIAFFISASASEFIMGHDYLNLSIALGKERIFTLSSISIVVLFAFYNRGHYFRRIPWWNQLRYVLLVCFFAFLLDGFIHFAIKYQFSRLWIGLSWLYAAILILIIRLAVWQILDRLFGCWKIDTYIVGSSDNVIDSLYALNSEGFNGYDVKAIYTAGEKNTFDREQFPAELRDIAIITDKKALNDALKPKKMLIIAPEKTSDRWVEPLIEKIEKEKKLTYAVVPPAKGFSYYGAAPQYFFGHDIMLVTPRAKIQTPFGKLVKRSIDIIGSGTGLIMLMPLFVILILLIRKDGGSAFFAHKRLGRNEEEFKCWKFRSMAIDADIRLKKILESDPLAKEEWEKDFKLKNDPRITKIGNFIRKTSLDELPQLWNVFVGEMSLVGPRPIVREETKYYDSSLSYYTSVRPGITGLWQVSGRNNTSYAYRVHMDSWYVKNWSIWHDVVILFKTVTAVLCKRGVY